MPNFLPKMKYMWNDNSRGNSSSESEEPMKGKKKKEVSITGIFRHDLAGIDVYTSKWVDPDYLAKSIGIDKNHMVKAKITLEVVEEPCEFCGKSTTGEKICQKCGKLVCDKCAKIDHKGRYCPICFDKIKSLSKLM